jgi:hypothetical protein
LRSTKHDIKLLIIFSVASYILQCITSLNTATKQRITKQSQYRNCICLGFTSTRVFRSHWCSLSFPYFGGYDNVSLRNRLKKIRDNVDNSGAAS